VHFTDTGDRYLVRFVDGQAQSPVPGQDPKPDVMKLQKIDRL